MRFDHLLKYAEKFEKLAAPDFATICKETSKAIQKEVAGGIASINRLVTTSKEAANSQGIESLDAAFGNIGNYARNITPDVTDIVISDLKAAIGNATFYTSSWNAGTGYDPVTRQGGPNSPAAYLNRIISLVDKLEKWNDYFKKQPTNTV